MVRWQGGQTGRHTSGQACRREHGWAHRRLHGRAASEHWHARAQAANTKSISPQLQPMCRLTSRTTSFRSSSRAKRVAGNTLLKNCRQWSRRVRRCQCQVAVVAELRHKLRRDSEGWQADPGHREGHSNAEGASALSQPLAGVGTSPHPAIHPAAPLTRPTGASHRPTCRRKSSSRHCRAAATGMMLVPAGSLFRCSTTIVA